MIRPVLATLIGCISFSVLGMENEENFFPWAAKTSEIKIQTIKETLVMSNVTATTTVGDIKTFIHDSEGIPPAQQKLTALTLIW